MTAVLVAVSAMLCGVVLAGCESTATGTPTPGSDGSETPVSTSSSADSNQLAPPVADPKDLRGIAPCELLTPPQLADLTIAEPGAVDTSPWGEQRCIWQNSTLSLGFSPDTTQGDGLETAYRNEHKYENFVPSEVDGYPAVRVDAVTTSCGVIVGVADDQALSVFFGTGTSDAPGSGDPCGFAESVVAKVLANLPAA